jgi:integrase
MALVKKCRHDRSRWSRCSCSWYADLRDETGKRTYTNLGPDGQEARRRYRAMTAAEPVGEVHTFRVARTSYLDECAHTLRPQSLARYESLTKHAEHFYGDAPLSGIDGASVVRMTDKLRAAGLANSHVRTIRNLTLAILRHAHERGMMKAVPQVPRMKMSRDDDLAEVETMELANAEAAIAAMPEPERSIAQVMLWTGLRPSEAVALRETDYIDPILRVERTAVTSTKRENAPKTRRGRRDVDLVSGAREALDRIEWPHGSTYKRLAERWRGGLAKARVPYVPLKTLRHTNASMRLAAGQSVPYVAQQLGHSPEILLHTYAHVIRSMGASQAALLEGARQPAAL